MLSMFGCLKHSSSQVCLCIFLEKVGAMPPSPLLTGNEREIFIYFLWSMSGIIFKNLCPYAVASYSLRLFRLVWHFIIADGSFCVSMAAVSDHDYISTNLSTTAKAPATSAAQTTTGFCYIGSTVTQCLKHTFSKFIYCNLKKDYPILIFLVRIVLSQLAVK